MDQKLALCITSLKEEAEAARAGAVASDLNSLITDLSDLCKQAVSDEDVSFAIAVVFDQESGIFNILETLLPVKDRSVVKARETCCALLAEFVEQIGERAVPHVAFVKENCMKLFKRDDSKVVQAAALSPLLSMLEITGARKAFSTLHADWSLAAVLLQEYGKAKTSGSLRCNILILSGYLVEYFPAAFHDGNVTELLKICLDTLEEQLRHATKDPSLILVSGLIKCLDSLLTWFDDSLPAGGSVDNSRKIYTYLRQIICYREDIKRYEVVKAGLRLLSRHAGLFAVRLVQDSKDFLDWLQTYCTHANALLRDAGLAAFNKFICVVSECLVGEDTRVQNGQAIYKHLMSTFLKIMDARDMESKLLSSVAVRGMGKMSPAIVKFSGKETLKQVFHRLIPFGGRTSKSGENEEYLLGHLDTLIGAFADIVIHLENVEDFMVSFIAEVTGNVFYQYPQLFPKQKKAICTTLATLFMSLYLKGTIFSIFLDNIVWSSLERTMESTELARGTGLPIWPDYVDLWSQLLDLSIQVTGEGGAAVHEEHGSVSEALSARQDGEVQKIDPKQFQEFIFDTLIRCIMKTLMELNLKYRVKAIDKQVPSGSLSVNDETEAVGVEPETEMEMIEPMNIVHMHKYLNLVEFILALLSRPYDDLFVKWVYPFGCCIMELSTQYPLISGNYKLLTTTIRNADDQGFFQSSVKSVAELEEMKMEEEWKFLFVDDSRRKNKKPLSSTSWSSEQQESCRLLFRRYLQEVLVASKRYKLELLASCLHLCLSAPPALIDFGSLVAPLQTALKIGLRYPPLASVAMDALERWRHLYPRQLDFGLPGIVASLSDYLAEVKSSQVSEASPGADQSGSQNGSVGGEATVASLSRPQMARLRKTRAKANQPGAFEVIQLRVQKFLGEIGHFNRHLVPQVDLLQVSSTGGLAWDSVDRVQFTLPFRDEKHDVWLDPLLPRVVELAMSSSDRRTKVSASELLQALCLVMLGNSAKGPVRRTKDKSHSVHLDKIYKRLFPAILRLAVDVELVTRQLFNEFAKQLIHWYTSNQQKENPETVALLDAILDGLVDADNGSLREYCAACFGEFLSWSVRHAAPETNDFVNVKSVLRRLYNRMDHPNPYKRLGASMAAYRIYPVLRGTPSIVDRYIFEMIFFCIKSLRLAEGDDKQLGTVKQLGKTLDCYLKLVERNIAVLQRARKDRPAFSTLDDFLNWLLEQTGQVQGRCRSRCMSSLSIICRSLSVGSLAGWFRARLAKGITIHDCIKGVDFELDQETCEKINWSTDEARHGLSSFIRSLHWFTWALQEKLFTVEELQKNTKIRSVVEKYLQGIFRNPESGSPWAAMTPAQREAHQRLKCLSIIHLLGLMKQILEIEFGLGKKGIFIPQGAEKEQPVNAGLLEELIPVRASKFHELLCLSILRPRDLGFVITDTRDAEELAGLAVGVMKMLTAFSRSFKDGFTTRLQALLNENKSKFDPSVFNFSLDKGEDKKGIGLEDATSLIKGYQQLHLAGALLGVLGKEEGNRLAQDLLARVVEIGRECPPLLESIASEMLSLSLALGTKVQRLLEYCLDEKIMSSSSSNARKVTAGAIFYLNFRKVIVRRVKFSFKDCQSTLLSAAVENSTARLLLDAILDDFIKSSELSDGLAKRGFLKEMLRNIKSLEPFCTPTANLAGKQFFLEVLRKLLVLDASNDLLLQQDQAALKFVEDTYISFLSSSYNQEESSSVSEATLKDSDFALKTQSLILLPLFLKAPFGQDFQTRLASALTKVVSDHLLVRERDLHSDSGQKSTYLQMLSRMLDSVSMSGSLMLLEVIFPLFLHPPKFIVKSLDAMVEKFVENLGEKRQDGLDLCLRILSDDTKLPRLRRAVIEKVFVPFVLEAPMDFVVAWYCPRIKGFVELLAKPPPPQSSSDAEREEDSLVVRMCHYLLVEQLFLKVEAPVIKEKITPSVPNAALIKQTMNESRAKNDPPVRRFPENGSLWRDLHVAAYKCLAAVVLRTQEQEKVFSILFKEGPSGLIWQHLIDTEKVYDDMPVETNQLSVASQTLREMRASQRSRRSLKSQGSTSGTLRTLSSQYFAGAGLSQDPTVINTFVGLGRDPKIGNDVASLGLKLDDDDDGNGNAADENSSAGLEERDSLPEAMVDEAVGLDQDDFDLHPCMLVVLRLIERLQTKFGRGQEVDMPDWMKGLHSTLENSATHVNIRLFLIKVVTKAWKVFTPHSQAWFRPIVQTILSDPTNSGGRSFHYMLRDICITILQWKFVKCPDSGVASSFVNYLMSVAAHGSNQVLRANVDIIRLMVGSWKEDIQLDKRIILNYLIAGGRSAGNSDRLLRIQRIVGLQLLGVITVSGLPICDPLSDQFSEKELYDALLLNLTFKGKEVYEASGELLGMALKQRHESMGSEQLLEAPLKACLFRFVRDGNVDTFLNIMNKVTLRYTPYTEGYAGMIIEMLPNLHGVFKTIALDIFLRFPKCLRSHLSVLLPSLSKLLTHRDEAAQFRALQLLSELVREEDSPDKRVYEKVLPVLLETFASHENVDCRQLYYQILIFLYEREGISSDMSIVRSLLVGLTDTSDGVRRKLQNFWHLQLSQDFGERFTQMISQMYDPMVEEYWAQFSNVLLLQLCHDSADYQRPIFNAPLSDCEFHEQTINTAWSGSSLPMTPLFSQSQSVSQNPSQDTQSHVILPSQRENGTAPRQAAGFIRATMNSTLTQTMDTLPDFTLGSQGSSLFAMSGRPVDATQREAATQDGGTITSDDSSVPRRRILSSNAARSQIIRGVMNANRRRDARAAQQASARGNKVQMMRRYRTGELPDIEIKYEEVLVPLAALAERDSTFARLLLTLIGKAVYSRSSSLSGAADQDGDVKSSMKKGIERALRNTRNGISFVGCVQALCLEDPGIWVEPKLVGSASLKSTNFHAGILVLEAELLGGNSEENVHSGSRSKRHKGEAEAATQKPSTLQEAWLELARLYHELGEDDVVFSLYRKNLTKRPITHKALEAQLAGDADRALRLYDLAIESMDDHSGLSGIELDIWYNQRLACLAELNRWRHIIEDTLVQAQDDESSSDLKRLWDLDMREPYLDLFLRGAMKVATSRSKATEFIQSSLEDPDKRELLMRHYGIQLAQLAVMNEQFDRARFYLSHCYRTFRQQWSALHPLAIGARHRQVQKLQKMVELDEGIDLLTSQQLTDIPRKIGEWRHRWPSPRNDGVEVWSDIVENRLEFCNKFQGLANKKLKPGADDIQTKFASKLDEERANIYSQAATGLTKQGAYIVAQQYMEEYMSKKAGHDGKYKLDYRSTKSLAKLRCLQASRVQVDEHSKAVIMLKEVLNHVKSNAQKPAAQNPTVQRGLSLLEANASMQLALIRIGCLPKVSADPTAVSECLELLGAAYVAYSTILSKQHIVTEEALADTQMSRQLAKVSLKFGQFCDDLLKSTRSVEWSVDVKSAIIEGQSSSGLPPASVYPLLVVKHIFKAMKSDTSLRAQHLVARLLSLISQYPETREEFHNLSPQVPSWTFIPWIPQMLAVMDQEEGDLFVGILEDIAKRTPQALYFAYHVSEKDLGSKGKRRTLRLAELLSNADLRVFVRALEDLTFPEQRLRDGLAQIRNCLEAGSDGKKAQALLAEVTADCLDVKAMSETARQAGEYNRKFARDWSRRVNKIFGDNGEKLLQMDQKGFVTAVRDLISNLQKAVQGLQSGVLGLGQLSQWMARFDQWAFLPTSHFISEGEERLGGAHPNGAIEIPGQYSGFQERGIVEHVKLVGFDQTLISLNSKQKPKLLTMRGSDEKEYKFIVKGGEDIRVDQRIEQLFEVMNGVLQRDSMAACRGLSVRTFAVVPVSKSCGLLQFVENTCVLEDVVKDGLVCKLPHLVREGKDAVMMFFHKLRVQHQEWISKRGAGSTRNPYDCFTNLYRKAGYEEIKQMFTTLQSQLPWDTFRAGVSRWATSAESYLALRSQFAKSLSVVSICGYVAGVGDRHLANTLVDMRSGSLVPIDFGYSFGTGVILLSVPELIPFRLTSQLTNFLLPLDALGLLRTDMVHTLNALHASRDVISAVMDVFVKEPLLDWKNEAMKTASSRERKGGDVGGGGADEIGSKQEKGKRAEAVIEQHQQQYVELKVENAQRKLELWNPAAITVSELQSSIHASKPYLSALQSIVRGTPDRNVRARINSEKCLSIQEQVDCLIDQATDPNLLGRIWTGWQAWV